MFAFKLKDTMHNAPNAKEHKLHISKINFLYINYYNYRKHRICEERYSPSPVSTLIIYKSPFLYYYCPPSIIDLNIIKVHD